MKSICFFAILLFTFAYSTFSYSQTRCPDPGGCRVVSFAAFSNTVGVVQFGNTTGKVYEKKKRVLCSGSDCLQFFTMAAALTGPLSSSSSRRLFPSDVDVPQVEIMVQMREISRNDTRLLGISYVDFLDGLPADDLPSKANLNSGHPNFKGAGDNGVLHVAPSSGDKLKFVHQILEKASLDRLLSPSSLRPSTKPLVCGTVDRDLTLQVFVETLDNLNVRLTFQPINDNRKKSGPATTFIIPPTNPQSANETISSASTTPALIDIPLLGHLFSHKRIRRTGSREELAIFISPLIISNDSNLSSSQAVTLGPAIQLTKFKQTTIGSTEFFQTLAMDPHGRFLIYTEYSKKCKKNILKFVGLDPSSVFGSKPGASRILKIKPKVLAGCGDFKKSSTGAYGIDVINLN